MKTFALIENGKVVNVILWDESPDGWQPPEGQTAKVVEEGVDAGIGYDYDGVSFLAPEPPLPPPPPPATAEQVLAERALRMAQATTEIDPLQDIIDMGEAAEEDEEKLVEWKQYRVAISKVQTQPGFPESVKWPQQPEI